MQDSLTEAQDDMLGTIDDVAEHVWWEFDGEQYRGPSTCGFAWIDGIDGRESFVRRLKSLAAVTNPPGIDPRTGDIRVELAGLRLHVTDSHDDGLRLNVTLVGDMVKYVDTQRLDYQEKVHRLVLERLQHHGYLQDAWVRSRMD